MVFPDNVRVSQIVDYWYCSERSRLMACLGLEAPKSERMDEGSNTHKWLEQRPKSGKELVLYERLKPYEPFTRSFENVKVIGHPDDLTVLGKGKVQIFEYKTVDKSSVRPWKTSLARYQTQVYSWILEPIVKGLGYQLSYTHKVIYFSRNALFLTKISVEHDPYCTERMLKLVFKFWETGEPLIKPLKWKCLECSSVFKDRCRVYKGGNL